MTRFCTGFGLTGFALAAVFLVACSNTPAAQDVNITPDVYDAMTLDADEDNIEPTDDGNPDLRDTIGGEDILAQRVDAGDPCAEIPMGFGCICEENSDCLSQYCILSPRENYSRCTKTCYDDCPEGWKCQEVSIGGADTVYVCRPVYDPLCDRECIKDSDCQSAGALCVQQGTKSYCLKVCNTVEDCSTKTRIKDCDDEGVCSFDTETTEEECLEDDLTCEVLDIDFECVETTNIESTVTSKQCVPTSGHCECASGTDYQSDANHCGDCEIRCFFVNASAYCTQGTCTLGGCLEGFINLNGEDEDGCEYECTFQSPTDHPDSDYIDANCDGIDGDLASGVFVKTGGDDDNFLGDAAHPFATIGAAIIFASEQTPKCEVYVSKGTYQEQVNLLNGVSVYGGYDAENGWKRNITSNEAIIAWNGQETLTVRSVVAKNITENTVFDGFRIKTSSSAQPSGSSYGMHVAGCSGNLVISNNYIEAGNGMDGRNGLFGSNGQPGSTGTKGSDAFVYDSCGVCFSCNEYDYDSHMKPGPGGSSPCGMFGGVGGNGGKLGKGGSSGNAAPNGGGSGGDGAIDEEYDGMPGSPGASEDSGDNGDGGLSAGEINASGFFVPLPGNDGTDGLPGKGGGGGGGGGGDDDDNILSIECYSAGGAGGGGGGGGCGGTAGSGGQGGGGSFGLFLVQSSPQIYGNTVKSYFGGNGGIGGAAGVGGAGGDSGDGGADTSDGAGKGGNGGDGGDGGNGGNGGGGPGGPSWAIYISGSSAEPVCMDNTLESVGFPGSGGYGGGTGGTVNKGQDGQSGLIYGITGECSLD